MSSLWLAFGRVGPLVFFGILPAISLVFEASLALHAHDFGPDFRREYYAEAKLIIHGGNPFPSPHADLLGGANPIYPIPVALLVAPLTLLSPGAATVVFVALLLGALAATARVLGVKDWRVYGLLAFWPASLGALQSGNLSILLALLAALAWRYRDHRYLPGLAVGAAIGLKLFLWPLLVWLLALRRYRAAAAGAAVGLASVLLVLPFASLLDYARLMSNLANTFGPMSYNVIGLLVKSGAGLDTARLAAAASGILVLAFAFVRRSFPLTVAASLLLSPIVWPHYFVLLFVPLAAASPRLSGAMLLPLALWPCPAWAPAVRLWHIVLGLAVVAAVTALTEWGFGPLDHVRRWAAAPARWRSVEP